MKLDFFDCHHLSGRQLHAMHIHGTIHFVDLWLKNKNKKNCKSNTSQLSNLPDILVVPCSVLVFCAVVYISAVFLVLSFLVLLFSV